MKPGDMVVVMDAEALPSAQVDLSLEGRFRLWGGREGPPTWSVGWRWPFLRRRWRCIVHLQYVGPR